MNGDILPALPVEETEADFNGTVIAREDQRSLERSNRALAL
jgi:hypothetical protein